MQVAHGQRVAGRGEALAEALAARLATLDRLLSRATGPGCDLRDAPAAIWSALMRRSKLSLLSRTLTGMKVFVATAQMQGFRPDDFCWTVEGELVQIAPFTCDCPDCGCDRAMSGTASSRGTTTFTVTDQPNLDEQTFVELTRDALEREGWISSGDQEDDALVAYRAREHLDLASSFEEGRILELRGNVIAER